LGQRGIGEDRCRQDGDLEVGYGHKAFCLGVILPNLRISVTGTGGNNNFLCSFKVALPLPAIGKAW
jgi:hypothetical protein